MLEQVQSPVVLHMNRGLITFLNLKTIPYRKIYNIRIMEEGQTIIALGAGGITKVYFPKENRLERVPNVSNYEIYIERIEEMLQRKSDNLFNV